MESIRVFLGCVGCFGLILLGWVMIIDLLKSIFTDLRKFYLKIKNKLFLANKERNETK